MSEREQYPAGVPCWVEGLFDNTDAAQTFYGGLFGWEFEGSGGDPEYFVARLRGQDVAGLASTPEGGTGGTWMTHVRVDDAAQAARDAEQAGGSVVAGPMDVAPAGSLAVLSDPAGAIFCAWQPQSREGAQLVNEPGAWAMSLLKTPDPDAVAPFYEQLFGWRTESWGPLTMFRLPGYVGGEEGQPVPRDVVAGMQPSENGDAGWEVDFWIPDADTGARRVTELGGSVVSGPADEPPFRHVVITDLEGAEITVSQLVAPPS